jgi:hypothetical protein
MDKMTYVKWPKLLVWHIATVDGTTVCGLPIADEVIRQRLIDPARRMCRSCDRMKDASTMRLTP